MEAADDRGFKFNHFPQPQHHEQQQQLLYQVSSEAMLPSSSSSAASSSMPPSFIGREGGGAYELGELDQAFLLYLDGQDTSSSIAAHDQKRAEDNPGMRPTLNIFPSQPMHVTPSEKVSSGIAAATPSVPKRESMALGNQRKDGPHQPPKVIKREGNRKGLIQCSTGMEGPKTPDPKILRRLAQNREAARKSRLRKKVYVQQLESSRMRLSQLEQELQKARAQGVFFGGALLGGGDQNGLSIAGSSFRSEAATVFDVHYARWMEEHHRRICELRSAAEDHGLPENELQLYVENCIAHFDEVMSLKSMLAKSDIFHLTSGMWMSPAERCFMWIGGFRPSHIIKIVLNQLEPLTEQQLMGICGLQQSTQEAEELLSQGLEGLNRCLSDAVTSDSLLASPTNIADFMGRMAQAINKLSTLEAFVRQADNLRHQTIRRLYQLLMTRQAARSLLAVAEYFHRLRALSSLWLSRPRQE